jgi:murein DD-endopeptidase MepM/ murein hydrolase activator NlpD
LGAFQRHRIHQPVIDLGDEDPLFTRNIANGAPDRRRISLRWLTGSVLTGLLSAGLVWGALQAAVGFDEHLIIRPALARSTPAGDQAKVAAKGDRFRPAPKSEVRRRVIQISTVTRAADRDIVRVRPFAHIQTNLAAPVSAELAARVPAFSPLELFAGAEGEAVEMVAASDSIYAAEVDGEVAIKVQDFPAAGAAYDDAVELAVADVEPMVREAAPFLTEGAIEISSLPYVDPARFEMASADPTGLAGGLALAIAPENVSLIEKTDDEFDVSAVDERVLEVKQNASLRQMLIGEGASEAEAEKIIDAMLANHEFRFLAGQTLLIGLAADGTGAVTPMRVALYDGAEAVAAVALSDHGNYVKAQAPELDEALVTVEQTETAEPVGALPSLHAGLWGTALSLDMPPELIENLVRIFSYDVDYQNRLQPSDSLEVIYSAEGDAEAAEILYAALSLGGTSYRFYRFRSAEDGTVDYFDDTGKSAQKFLVRKPVAQGRFTSSFGMRRHPILRRLRMHSGIDWAAPTGTPIIAAGNGVVESVGTRAGYGRSIVMHHANGYETTYNHMSGYARGIGEGDRVRQGQVIGYVGSSGLSTGPHLHYEVLVNGRFVDPMKIRLPRGRELQGAELAAFDQERQRIDELLARDDQRLAAN